LKPERRAKNNQRAATMAELEAILESLMLEVGATCPSGYDSHATIDNWAHMTAMFVSEVVKRRHSPRETIIRKARKAVRRRIERELADSYLGMVLPERKEVLQTESTEEEVEGSDVPGADTEPRKSE